VKLLCRVSPRVAVVFDVDDTLIHSDSGLEITAGVDLFHSCVASGAHVFIVTARPERARRDTLRELATVGIVQERDGTAEGFVSLWMMPNGFTADHVAEYKMRARAAAKKAAGGRFLMTIGDQWWDCVGSARVEEQLVHKTEPDGVYVLTDMPVREPATVAIKFPDLFDDS